MVFQRHEPIAVWGPASPGERVEVSLHDVYLGDVWGLSGQSNAQVSFETFGSALMTSDGEMPRYFEIAANKQEFKPAEAKIEGNTVVLWNDEIDKPHDVRYGFDEAVLMKLNLTNADGIPAAVFWARAQNQLHPGLLNEMNVLRE